VETGRQKDYARNTLMTGLGAVKEYTNTEQSDTWMAEILKKFESAYANTHV
jgi:hypothetical protein